MQTNKFDRNSAFSIDIQDQEDKSGVVDLLTIDGQFLIFKSSSIYRGLTADAIDPNKHYLETRHSYEKLYSVGANNSYVARMILQFKEILGLAVRDIHLKEKLLSHVWKANKILLECESSHYSIYKRVTELAPLCDEIIETNKTKQFIPALPKVEDLSKHVEHFLNNGKLFLISAFEILHVIYQMPFTDRTSSHFDKHCEWVKSKFGASDPLCQLLDQDKEWITLIAELRNAIQHPSQGQKVEIENIVVKPGNKFTSPAWRYDLTKKNMGKKNDLTDLVIDLNVYSYNFLTFFEELLVLCLKKELSNNQSFLDIYKKNKENIQPECPIMYFVQKKVGAPFLNVDL